MSLTLSDAIKGKVNSSTKEKVERLLERIYFQLCIRYIQVVKELAAIRNLQLFFKRAELCAIPDCFFSFFFHFLPF